MGVYEDTLDQIANGQGPALGTAAMQAYSVNPDQYAAQKKLAVQSGLPVHVLPQLSDEAKFRVLAGDFSDIKDSHPATAQFLSDPENAKIAHDDLPSLTGVEDIARYGFPKAAGTSTLSIDGSKRPTMLPSALDSNELVTKPLKSLVGSSVKTFSRVASLIEMPGGPEDEADYLKQLSGLYDWAENLRKEGQPAADLGVGGSIFRSMVGLAPYLFAGPAGVGLLVGNAYNDRRDELLAQGVEPNAANMLAGLSGLGAYAFTKIPFGGKSLAASVTRGMALNPAAGALERAIEKSALSGMGYDQQAARTQIMAPQDLITEMVMGAFFGAQHAMHAGVPTTGNSLAESVIPFWDAIQAKRRADALTAAGKIVTDSKVGARDPDLMAAQLKDVFGRQDITHLFVPVEQWQELYQTQGLDPAKVAEENLADPTAYTEALRTGSSVVVPVEDFVGRLSRVPGYENLVREASPALGESSLRQAEEAAQTQMEATDRGEGVLGALRGMVESSARDTAGRESYLRVRDDLTGQLMATGMPEDVARENAQMVANTYRVLGERTGTAPEDLYGQFPVRVGREGGGMEFAQSDRFLSGAAGEVARQELTTLYHSAYHGSPHKFERFSTEHIGTGEGAQAYGYGMYFAGAKDVAEFYRKNLAEPALMIHGEEVKPAAGSPADIALSHLQTASELAPESPYTFARATVVDAQKVAMPDRRGMFDEAKRILKEWEKAGGKIEQGGRTYRVDLAPAEDEYLDWDKPLGEQSEKIKATVERLYGEAETEAKARLGGIFDAIEADPSMDKWVREALTDYRAELAKAKSVEDVHDVAVQANADLGWKAGSPLEQLSKFVESYEETQGPAAGETLDLSKTGAGLYSLLVGQHGTQQAASKALLALGIRGIRYLDGSSRAEGEGSHNYVIFDDKDVSIKEYWADEKRAKIRFDPQNLGAGFDVTLLKGANASSFLHELGHYFTAVLGDLASRPDAPEQVKGDFATLLKFVGAESRETLQTEHHETLARAFEAYLMEGKAPSAEVHGLFQRIKWWMVSVYKDLKALHVQLTDEVRGVFDRLVATDDEINRTRQREGMTPIFSTPESAGMTPKEFDLYRGTVEKASEDAKEKLFRRLVDEQKREQERWWKDASAKIKGEVETEAQADPAYTAYHAITTGKDWEGNDVGDIRLSRQALVERYGEEGVKALPRSFRRLYAKEGGLHPDLVAETFGLGSGDELVQRILSQPRYKDYVAGEVTRRMQAEYGDLLKSPAQMADAARDAVENDAQGRVLRAEAEALHRLQRTVKPFVNAEKEKTKQAEGDAKATARWYDAERKTAEANRAEEARATVGAVPPLSTFRQIARDTMDAKRVAEIQPNLYAMARQKASKEAFEAAAKGDYQGAFDAKMKELLNLHLEKEARAAVEFSDKVQQYAAKMATTKQLGKIGLAGQEFLEQIRGILERYSFVPVSNAEANRLETLREFVDRLRDPEGEYLVDLPIPPELLDATRATNYRNLSLGELRAVYDSMRMIQKAAYLVNTTAAEGKRAERAEAQTRLAFAIGTHVKDGGHGLVSDSARSWFDRMKDATPDIALLRPEFIFERLDGGKQGPFHEYIWDRYNDAADFQNRLREELFPVIMDYARGSEIDRGQRYFIKSLGVTLTKDDILSIALNSGNESNLDKLMRGGLGFKGHEPVQIDHGALQEILSHLNPAEIGVVNGIWRTIEKLKPYASELAKKRLGIEPEWIEAQPMDIAQGRLEGGYYPVKYDPRFSKAGEKQSDASTLDQMFRKYAGSNTRQGYMKERTGFVAPLSLDWQAVVSRHLDEVITDISHWQFATDTQRLLKSKTVKDAVIGHLGDSYYKNLLDWVRYTVNQDTMGREASDNFEKWRRRIRSNMSTYLLGFRVLNSVAEMGITPVLAFQQVKDPRSVVTGMMTYLRNPMDATDFANRASDWHKELQFEFGRDINQAMADLAGKHTVLDDVKRWSIECRQAMWKIGATMAWHIGYADALKQGLEGEAAVRVADSIYRMTQEGGRAGDLSAIERNPNMRELTMFVGPQLIQYNNFARAARAVFDRGFNAQTAQIALTTFLAGHVANALLFELMRGRYPDDPDKIPAWILARLTFGLFDGIPVIREGAKYAETKFLHEPVQDVKPLPVLQATKEVFDTVLDTAKLTQGEDKWGSVAGHAARVAGYATGLPMLQATATGKFLYDVLEGNYEPKHVWSPVTDTLNYHRSK